MNIENKGNIKLYFIDYEYGFDSPSITEAQRLLLNESWKRAQETIKKLNIEVVLSKSEVFL